MKIKSIKSEVTEIEVALPYYAGTESESYKWVDEFHCVQVIHGFYEFAISDYSLGTITPYSHKLELPQITEEQFYNQMLNAFHHISQTTIKL